MKDGLPQLRGFLLEHLAVADDRVERRAQLVRHAGEEAGLLPSGLGERDVRVLEPRRAQTTARWRSALRRSLSETCSAFSVSSSDA